MKDLEKLIGSARFRNLSYQEKNEILELIDANPVFEHLIAGILASPNWRITIYEAYVKYVRNERPIPPPPGQVIAHFDRRNMFDDTQFTTSKIIG